MNVELIPFRSKYSTTFNRDAISSQCSAGRIQCRQSERAGICFIRADVEKLSLPATQFKGGGVVSFNNIHG